MTRNNQTGSSESEAALNQRTQSGDTIFQVLSNSRRRRLIWCLAMAPNWSMTKREIAAHIAAVENQAVATRDVDYGDVTNIVHKLQNYHLSPLEDSNVITVDGDRITATPHLLEVMPILVHGQCFTGPQ